jgi:hypothetical protein
LQLQRSFFSLLSATPFFLFSLVSVVVAAAAAAAGGSAAGSDSLPPSA